MTKEDGERQQTLVWIKKYLVLTIKDGVFKKINVHLVCILCTSALPLICASPFLLCLSEVCSIHGLLALLGEILHSGGPKWQLHKLCPPGMNSAYMVSSPVDHADYEG